MKIISIILIFIAGNCKGVMDTLQFHFSESIFSNPKFNQQFWNPDLGWTNKDRNHDTKQGRAKWFRLIPIPVFLTDGWHQFQFWFLNLFTLAAVLYHPIINPTVFKTSSEIVNLILAKICDLVILGSALRLGFVLQYNYLLLKKKL